jgi:replication fork clamp-binding protein CrfC
MSGTEHEEHEDQPWGSGVGDSLVPPNKSPHRFGERPESPILARQYDEMIARERKRDGDRAAAQREQETFDEEVEREAQKAAAIELRKRELLDGAA